MYWNFKLSFEVDILATSLATFQKIGRIFPIFWSHWNNIFLSKELSGSSTVAEQTTKEHEVKGSNPTGRLLAL
jgi:hypothetical protein